VVVVHQQQDWRAAVSFYFSFSFIDEPTHQRPQSYSFCYSILAAHGYQMCFWIPYD
jgi:hypothetical protein